ncbi:MULTISPECIES: glutathione S-transferase family protein [Rhodanobacter]|uniref:Glutathione S-transferase family protein n=1 Tax=Rhodanobacter hydrolyticus TaxID=2250595 RepID=A0ABW8J6T1_9GAMM|nr:glutathione S-transferase family protein [Rhodanobacter sp. 7MK24]MBD8880020.1 glutathione S-transferase family protein [Rhodanobacter sp. 7MK24]
MVRIKLIGSYLSPYVRKVLVCLELKELEYEIDPMPPFVGNEAFARISPLKRVPVLVDDGLVLNDSSVICQYLEDKYPTPAVFPHDIVERARARWLEEYADTRLADGLIWRLFYQRSIRRRVFNEPPDEGVVTQALEVEIPAAIDYLETQLPEDGFIFGALSIADVSITSYFRTAFFARYTIDATRWPRTAGLVERTLALPVMQKLARYEDCTLRLPLAEQRQALIAAGAPLSSETMGTTAPRPILPRTS